MALMGNRVGAPAGWGQLILGLVASVAVLTAACGTPGDEASSGDEVADPAPATSTTDPEQQTSRPPTVPPPTMAPSVTLGPQYRVPYSDQLLKASDFAGDPEQYTDEMGFKRLLFYDVVCEGVPDIAFSTDPRSEALSTVVTGHYHFARSLTYDTQTTALAAMETLDLAYEGCNGTSFLDPNRTYATHVHVETVAQDAPQVENSARSSARTLQHTNRTDIWIYHLYIGVVDSTLFVVASTDAERAYEVAGVVAGRLNGVEPAQPVESTGSWGLIHGYGHHLYWSQPVEGPRRVRLLQGLTPEVAAWIEEVDDERIDEIASIACAFSALILDNGQYPERFDRTVSELFNWFERDENSFETLREIYDTIANLYCPGLTQEAERLRADA